MNLTKNETKEIERMQIAYFHFIEDYQPNELSDMYTRSSVFIKESINKYRKWYQL